MGQATDIIQLTEHPQDLVSALILFPGPEFLIGPPALSHIKSVALLRLRDQTVWMLILQGQAWTTGRVRAAAEVLAGVSRQNFATSSIARLLREELALPSLSARIPRLDRIDERLWEVGKVAFAAVRQPAAKRLYSEIDQTLPEESEWTVRSVLRDGLDEALRDFVSAMDPQALRIATAESRFDLRVYNYLVHRECRQYRLQFAETFPSLLQTAVVAGAGSLGDELRSIVDEGAPLIKELAARWDVRRGVIRHLVGRASNNVGFQWNRDAMGLALALNALHPQDVPGDSRAEWDEFNRAVVTGERLFLQPVWQSTAGLEWLKVCIRLSRRADKEALANWLPKWNDIDQIVRFRAALTQIVQQQVSPNRSNPASDADTTVANAVDRAVLNIADQGLLDAARLFFEELGRAQKKERARQTLSREILMPLMPEDFISDDGATRVTALCTNHQLLQHGKKMCNCLRYTSVASFARKGKAGTVFIVGLYDMLSGKALSTAEIRAYPGRDDAPYQLGIRQHTGKANARPSSRCARVLREFLRHCLTEEIRQHVLSNWTVLRGRSKPDAKEPPRLPVALRSTLGEQLYEGLVTSIRGTNNYRHGDMHGG